MGKRLGKKYRRIPRKIPRYDTRHIVAGQEDAAVALQVNRAFARHKRLEEDV